MNNEYDLATDEIEAQVAEFTSEYERLTQPFGLFGPNYADVRGRINGLEGLSRQVDAWQSETVEVTGSDEAFDKTRELDSDIQSALAGYRAKLKCVWPQGYA